jgi:hypothetical protein
MPTTTPAYGEACAAPTWQPTPTRPTCQPFSRHGNISVAAVGLCFTGIYSPHANRLRQYKCCHRKKVSNAGKEENVHMAEGAVLKMGGQKMKKVQKMKTDFRDLCSSVARRKLVPEN